MTASDCKKLVVAEDEHLISLYVARAVGEAHEFHPDFEEDERPPQDIKKAGPAWNRPPRTA